MQCMNIHPISGATYGPINKHVAEAYDNAAAESMQKAAAKVHALHPPPDNEKFHIRCFPRGFMAITRSYLITRCSQCDIRGKSCGCICTDKILPPMQNLGTKTCSPEYKKWKAVHVSSTTRARRVQWKAYELLRCFRGLLKNGLI